MFELVQQGGSGLFGCVNFKDSDVVKDIGKCEDDIFELVNGFSVSDAQLNVRVSSTPMP